MPRKSIDEFALQIARLAGARESEFDLTLPAIVDATKRWLESHGIAWVESDQTQTCATCGARHEQPDPIEWDAP